MVEIINLNSREKYGSAKDKALTPTQRIEIYKTLNDPIDKVLFILGCYAGMRVQEIKQCRKEWLNRTMIGDKEYLAINIPDECRNIDNKYSIWRPKTKRGRTTYILDKEKWLEVENFFNYKENIDITIRSLQNRAYKMSNVSPHAFRATAQNYLKYEREFIPEVIAQMLGHKDVRTTMQHYNTMNKAQTESYLQNKN